jgi:hypothetical protein
MCVTDCVRVGDVRLDVEHGRSVEHVDVPDVQREPFDTLEPHRRQPQRIRAMRRARREHPFASREAARRQHLRPPPGVAVEPEQHPDVFPAVEIAQRVLVVLARQYFDHAGDALAERARLARGFDLLDERRAHVADRLE